jgi:hypothetical protein
MISLLRWRAPLTMIDEMPKPQRLRMEQQRFVVEALAAYRTPQEVVELVNEVYGLKLSRQAVHRYDPTHGRPAKKWRVIFDAAREQFLRDAARFAVAHQSYRIQEIEAIYRAAKRSGNYRLCLDALEQAAKEEGGLFTSRRHLDDRSWDLTTATDDQLRRIAAGEDPRKVLR